MRIADMFKSSRFYSEVCPCRYLRGGIDGPSIDENPNSYMIDHDYLSYYMAYLSYEDMFRTFWDQCSRNNKPIGFDKESCYSFLFHRLYREDGRPVRSVPELLRSREVNDTLRDTEWCNETMKRYVQKYGKE